MAFLDILIGLVLAIAIIVGLRRGFFMEALGFSGAIGGALAGIWGAAAIGSNIADWMPDFSGRTVVAYLGTFMVLFIAFYFLSRLVANFFKDILENLKLGWLNNALGGVLAGLKASIVMSVIFMYASFTPFQGLIDSSKDDSFFYEPIERVFPLLYELLGSPDELPEPLRKVIEKGKKKAIEGATDEFKEDLFDER